MTGTHKVRNLQKRNSITDGKFLNVLKDNNSSQLHDWTRCWISCSCFWVSCSFVQQRCCYEVGRNLWKVLIVLGSELGPSNYVCLTGVSVSRRRQRSCRASELHHSGERRDSRFLRTRRVFQVLRTSTHKPINHRLPLIKPSNLKSTLMSNWNQRRTRIQLCVRDLLPSPSRGESCVASTPLCWCVLEN